MTDRTATVTRRTQETDVRIELSLDPTTTGDYRIHTGVGFLDHMLDHVARHGRLRLHIGAEGDTHVDDHHTVEDVGIGLGEAIHKALGDKKGIERYGDASVPMDEALARVSLDLSGRSALAFDVRYVNASGKIGTFDVQLVREFFQAVTRSGRFACHIEVVRGDNDHHIVEAVFKAFGRSLRQAATITGDEVPSTKGTL